MANNEVIKRLFSSFDELESSIDVAKKALSIRVPLQQALLQRISNYEDVLMKQRKLADRLCDYIARADWDEVNRHVRLINGLSAMIYGDAKELTESLLGSEPVAVEEEAKVAN